MKVMITGATGFIGGHVLRALVDAGHEPRALVRSMDKLGTVLRLHGLDPIDAVVGDITDRVSVDEALADCSACIHTAAVTALKRSEAETIGANNVEGGRTVLDAAVAAGCDPIVHVSTVSAVFPPQGPMLSPDDPVTDPQGAYSKSKAAIDRHARALQDAGSPVVVVYPGGVVGPTDAGVNVLADGMSRIINSGLLAFPQGGGNSWVDVRDLSAALVGMLESGKGPRRYMAGGPFLPWSDFIDLLQDLCSGDFDVQRPPDDVLKSMAEDYERAAAETGEDPPLDYESAAYMCDAGPTDDSRLIADYGITWRPTRESWRDMLAWCAQQGLLEPARSGKLLADGAT